MYFLAFFLWFVVLLCVEKQSFPRSLIAFGNGSWTRLTASGNNRYSVASNAYSLRIPLSPPAKKPLLSTTTKGVFSCILGKNKAKSCNFGLQSGRSTIRKPGFCFQDAKTRKNAGVLFAFLCSAKNAKNIRDGGI